jgi:hypothetical protein
MHVHAYMRTDVLDRCQYQMCVANACSTRYALHARIRCVNAFRAYVRRCVRACRAHNRYITVLTTYTYIRR